MESIFVLLVASVAIAMVLLPAIVGLCLVYSFCFGSRSIPKQGATKMSSREFRQRLRNNA